MRYGKRVIRCVMQVWVGLLLGLLACLLITLLAGCKTRYITQEVPVVVEHTSVQHHTDIVRDTLMMRDSVYHFIQGDTTIIERWHYQVKIEKVAIADTVRDTIPKVVTVTKTEVQKVNEIKWWQTGLITLGSWSALFLLIGAGFMLWSFRH